MLSLLFLIVIVAGFVGLVGFLFYNTGLSAKKMSDNLAVKEGSEKQMALDDFYLPLKKAFNFSPPVNSSLNYYELIGDIGAANFKIQLGGSGKTLSSVKVLQTVLTFPEAHISDTDQIKKQIKAIYERHGISGSASSKMLLKDNQLDISFGGIKDPSARFGRSQIKSSEPLVPVFREISELFEN